MQAATGTAHSSGQGLESTWIRISPSYGGRGGRILNQPILCFEGRGRSLGSIHSAVGERDRATTLVLFPHRV